MTTVFDLAALVKAWEAHDRFCYSLSPTEEERAKGRKSKHLPNNGGVEVTARLLDEQKRAAEALGVHPDTLVALVMLERRTDPGPDVSGALNRVLEGLTFSTQHCTECGVEMPNYQIYRDYHAEHCPETGAQR